MIEIRKVEFGYKSLWQFALRVPYVVHLYFGSDGMFVFALCPHYSILGDASRNVPASLLYIERSPKIGRWPATWLCHVERFPDPYDILEEWKAMLR